VFIRRQSLSAIVKVRTTASDMAPPDGYRQDLEDAVRVLDVGSFDRAPGNGHLVTQSCVLRRKSIAPHRKGMEYRQDLN
jgi:hypothetical protein